jgi:hypothetical protein
MLSYAAHFENLIEALFFGFLGGFLNWFRKPAREARLFSFIDMRPEPDIALAVMSPSSGSLPATSVIPNCGKLVSSSPTSALERCMAEGEGRLVCLERPPARRGADRTADPSTAPSFASGSIAKLSRCL